MLEMTAISFSLVVALRVLSAVLPEKPPLELGAATTIGSREVQADQLAYAQTDAGCFLALADGIGAGEKGKIAASLAVDSCENLFQHTAHFDHPGFFFQKAFTMANRNILQVIDDATAGANLLLAVVAHGKLHYALAGNCVIALWRGGELIPLSEGHTIDVLAKQSFQRGRISRQDALAAVQERRVYNFVGQDGFRNIEYCDEPVSLKKDDVIVMMTDGVIEHFGLGKLERLLAERTNCETLAFAVTDAIAMQTGEKDNATVLLLRVNQVV